MSRRVARWGCLVAVAVAVHAAHTTWAETTGDPRAGRVKAGLCAACHGPDGISINPLWPSLAGQQPVYLAKQIRAFRDGERVDVSMQPFVQNLTDQDVEDLAAFYAGLSPCP